MQLGSGNLIYFPRITIFVNCNEIMKVDNFYQIPPNPWESYWQLFCWIIQLMNIGNIEILASWLRYEVLCILLIDFTFNNLFVLLYCYKSEHWPYICWRQLSTGLRGWWNLDIRYPANMRAWIVDIFAQYHIF